jgi:hypothetical protein
MTRGLPVCLNLVICVKSMEISNRGQMPNKIIEVFTVTNFKIYTNLKTYENQYLLSTNLSSG